MPRPGPARPMVGVRLSDAGVAWLDDQARELGITRSAVIRMCLRFARQNEWTFNAWWKGMPGGR